MSGEKELESISEYEVGKIEDVYKPPKNVGVKESAKFVPVSQETIQNLVMELGEKHGVPTEVKIKVIDLINTNNAQEIGSYQIDYIPGCPIRIENGKVNK